MQITNNLMVEQYNGQFAEALALFSMEEKPNAVFSSFSENVEKMKGELEKNGFESVLKAKVISSISPLFAKHQRELSLEDGVAICLENLPLFKQFQLVESDMVLQSEISSLSLSQEAFHRLLRQLRIMIIEAKVFQRTPYQTFQIKSYTFIASFQRKKVDLWYYHPKVFEGLKGKHVTFPVYHLIERRFDNLSTTPNEPFLNECTKREVAMLRFFEGHPECGKMQTGLLFSAKHKVTAAYYISKQYAGGKLDTWLQQNKPPLKERIGIVYQIMKEIAYPMLTFGEHIRHLNIQLSSFLIGSSVREIVLANWIVGAHQNSEDEIEKDFDPALMITAYRTQNDIFAIERALRKNDPTEFKSAASQLDLLGFAMTFYAILTEAENNDDFSLKLLKSKGVSDKVMKTLDKMLLSIRHRRLTPQQALQAWEAVYREYFPEQFEQELKEKQSAKEKVSWIDLPRPDLEDFFDDTRDKVSQVQIEDVEPNSQEPESLAYQQAIQTLTDIYKGKRSLLDGDNDEIAVISDSDSENSEDDVEYSDAAYTPDSSSSPNKENEKEEKPVNVDTQ
jgi:hypothetical protein